MLRRLLPLLLLFACSIWTVAPAHAVDQAAEDALTIVFTANSGGEFEPCPVCGGKALGGLARRATAFARLRSDLAGSPVLFLAGPNEFQPPAGLKHPVPVLAQALGKAYTALGYDAVFCDPMEEYWLRESGAELPPALHAADSRTQIFILEVHGMKVGVMLLPRLLKGAEKPSADLIRSVARKARNLAERADLVVGISPWGGVGEAALLSKAPPVFDLLLGAGPGPGLAGRFVEEGKTFWARAYTMGKAFHVIRMRTLPRRDEDWRWAKNENMRLDFTVLDKDVPSDPAMAALLDEFDPPTVK